MPFPDGPALEPAPLRPAAPGTRMVWRRLDGYATERGVIGSVDQDLLAHYQWEGQPRSMYFFCINCAGDEVSFDHAAYQRLFPLERGKSVTFRRSVGEWDWVNRISVIGTERLSLEFGEVDAYVIASATEGQNNPFHAENEIWYAPSIGWNVQFRYRNSLGEAYSWQAVEFIPPH
ncbi:MAG: hypothetical protein GTO67_01825 [Gammaproteobacteria bacterium]|nr:hypothetical protein [Gammaproteobacteria bacterium]NIM72436.1 hypothetical protein [Gammaproteobacteria bacterium]NIN37480.1 hypothetical protein [Gammaproteobacteria bacterium]NIO24193.1 hypothetical protein [Gammaproteobacteria bacterium]NIO64802.1 hypothetical protein [Gammaproteobacteria bacterium]